MKLLESAAKRWRRLIWKQVAVIMTLLAINRLHQDIPKTTLDYCSALSRMNMTNKGDQLISESSAEKIIKLRDMVHTGGRDRYTDTMVSPDMSFFAPGKVNVVSNGLKTMVELVEESKRLHLSALRLLIGEATKVVWIDFASTRNRGDSAINLGQINAFSALGLEVIFICHYQRATSDVIRAREIADQYNRNDVVVLSSGGGSIGVWETIDNLRFEEMAVFHDYKIIILPQSIWFFDDEYMRNSTEQYSKFKDLTVLLRDERSYNLAQKVFTKAPCFLVPDMAFHLGIVHRHLTPTHNIRWLERSDKETAGSYAGPMPDDLTVIKGDWLPISVQVEDTLVDHTYSASASGFLFMQQGQIVITDRLHAVIMASLLELPTVVIDNGIGKLSSYINTWMSGVEKITMATNGTDAIQKARQIHEKYRYSLPIIRQH